jgi:hypothetical protein
VIRRDFRFRCSFAVRVALVLVHEDPWFLSWTYRDVSIKPYWGLFEMLFSSRGYPFFVVLTIIIWFTTVLISVSGFDWSEPLQSTTNYGRLLSSNGSDPWTASCPAQLYQSLTCNASTSTASVTTMSPSWCRTQNPYVPKFRVRRVFAKAVATCFSCICACRFIFPRPPQLLTNSSIVDTHPAQFQCGLPENLGCQ